MKMEDRTVPIVLFGPSQVELCGTMRATPMCQRQIVLIPHPPSILSPQRGGGLDGLMVTLTSHHPLKALDAHYRIPPLMSGPWACGVCKCSSMDPPSHRHYLITHTCTAANLRLPRVCRTSVLRPIYFPNLKLLIHNQPTYLATLQELLTFVKGG